MAAAFLDDDDDLFVGRTQAKLPLLHSYDGKTWEPRGELVMSSQGDTRRKPSVTITNSQFDKTRLDMTGLYFIKLENPSGSSVSSVIRSCNLIAADLTDTLQLVVSPESFEVLGVNYVSDTKCRNRTAAKSLHSVGDVLMPHDVSQPRFRPPKPPQPPAQTSFFWKYWWAIIPAVLFILTSGQADPQAQQQGGGGASVARQ